MSYEFELINALKSKDKNKIQEVFKEIYETYYKLVYFCVGNYLPNKEDIEDITSEVFINFFNHLDNIKLNGNIKYYLTRSAKNLSINYLKKSSKQIEIKEIEKTLGYVIYYSDLLSLLKDNLTDLERECVISHILEGYSLREIAKDKLMNVNTIKSVYRRALFKLKYLLKGEE